MQLIPGEQATQGLADQHIYDELAARKFLPTRVNAQVARICNLACAMCGHSIWKRNKGFMPEAVFSRVLEEMRLNNITDLGFGGAQGEPLLCPSFADYLDRAIAAGLDVEINTNCTPLGERNIARMANAAKSGRLRVQASFSGYDKESYEFIYKGAKFEQSSRKLKQLYDAFASVNQLKSLSIRGCILNGTPVSRHSDYIASLGIDLSALLYVALVPADNFAGTVPYTLRAGMLHTCDILVRALIVYDDGKVSACACRDSEGAMEIGDIMQEGFLEMRNGERFQGFLRAFMQRDISGLSLCSKCDLAH